MKRFFQLQIIFWMIALFLLFMTEEGSADDLNSVVSRGNGRYQSGDFSGAASDYSEAITNGLKNGDLYYNLGNAYYRMGDFAKAVGKYRLALLYAPGDADIRANLNLARKRLADNQEASVRIERNALGDLLFLREHFSVVELERVFLIAFSAFFITVLLSFYISSTLLRVAQVAIFGLAAITGFSVYFVRIDARGSPALALSEGDRILRPAVVVGESVNVFSGDSETFQVIFVLRQGAELETGEARGEWVQVLLDGDKRGWVKHSALEILSLG